MKRILFFVALACLVFACISKQERKLRLIAGDKFKYWLVLEPDSKGKTKTIYRFSRDGKWEVFDKHANGVFEKYDGGDVFLIEKWNFDQDKINIGGRNYSILKLNASNFYIEFENDTTKMIPAHDSLLISKPKPTSPRYRVYVEKIAEHMDSTYINTAGSQQRSFTVFDFQDDYFNKMMYMHAVPLYNSEQAKIKKVVSLKNNFPASEYSYIEVHPKAFPPNWHLLFGHTFAVREEVLLCIIEGEKIVDVILLAGSYGDGEVYNKVLSIFDVHKNLFMQISYDGIYFREVEAEQIHIDSVEYSTLKMSLNGIIEIQKDSVKKDFILK